MALLVRNAVAGAALLLLLLPQSVAAQSPRVYRDRIEPHWFAQDTKFWYRNALPEGRSEFVVVDVSAQTRGPAFDHRRVAAVLAELTSEPVEAERLPFRSLEFSQDAKSVALNGKQAKWKLNLQSYEISPVASIGSEISGTDFFLPPRKSVDRGGDVQLKVINRLKNDIQLIWISRDGSEISYGTIKSGQSRPQHTFAGHIWLLKSGDRSLSCFEAFDNSNEIVISRKAIDQVKQPAALPKRERSRRDNRQSRKPELSPDRKFEAYVDQHNLWLRFHGDDAQQPPRQLTTDATERHTFRKDASRARLVQMAYTRKDFPADVANVRWSPDSNYLVAFQTTQVSERRVQYIESSPTDQLQPKLHSYPYAKPGDEIPVSTPRLFAVDDGAEIQISTELFPDPFDLKFLKFSDDGQKFWMMYNERAHQAIRVLEVSVADGSVRSVVDEHSDTFIHYSSDGKMVLEWLSEKQLIWASERSGWNHLYLYDVPAGKVTNAITTGKWNVRRIEHIDRDAGTIWFYAVGVAGSQDPYHEHFCRVNFDGSGFQVLTEGDGTHEITWSPDRKVFFDRYSRVDLPPVTELRDSSDGHLIAILEQADASEILKSRGQFPLRFAAKGRDGKTDIYGIIHLPRNFDAKQRYPVVENIYAGPHDHHVPKKFRSRYRHQHQIADRGMIVVQIDGMGTAWRSKKFHDVCYRNLRDAGFPDRIQWMKAAAQQHSFMDINRVGIYGGSAGGQNAMAALLWHGTFYKAAVADCGCHDNRMDKLWWNEQWMGRPVDDIYAMNSNTENAFRLQGHLMLVVGELDRNVDPASTTQVVNALIKANKDFTFLPIPGAGHGACERPYGAKRRANFLASHLNAGHSNGD